MNNKFWTWIVVLIAIAFIFSITVNAIYFAKAFEYVGLIISSLMGVWHND